MSKGAWRALAIMLLVLIAMVLISCLANNREVGFADTRAIELARCGRDCLATQAVVETMWQGRWAMLGAITSVVTLIITGISIIFVWRGLRTAQMTLIEEFRPYVRPQARAIKEREKGAFVVQAAVKNYGRTPAYSLKGEMILVLHVGPLKDEKNFQFRESFEEAVVHPGELYGLRLGEQHLLGKYIADNNVPLVLATVRLTLSYMDKFNTRQPEVSQETFVCRPTEDGGFKFSRVEWAGGDDEDLAYTA